MYLCLTTIVKMFASVEGPQNLGSIGHLKSKPHDLCGNELNICGPKKALVK
jgi:hypothetical protein